MPESDALLARIEAFHRARGGGILVRKAARGYSLFSARTGTPIARLRPTGGTDRVQVLWWNGARWRASGPFGMAILYFANARDASELLAAGCR